MRSYTGIDELYDLSHVLELQYIGHYLRHDLPNSLKVLTLVFDQGTLQQLNQILFDYLSVIDCFFSAVEQARQHV